MNFSRAGAESLRPYRFPVFIRSLLSLFGMLARNTADTTTSGLPVFLLLREPRDSNRGRSDSIRSRLPFVGLIPRTLFLRDFGNRVLGAGGELDGRRRKGERGREARGNMGGSVFFYHCFGQAWPWDEVFISGLVFFSGCASTNALGLG